MNFTVAGTSLLNNGEVIANLVPRIRGVYSAEPEEPPWLLLEVSGKVHRRRLLSACGAAGPVEP